MNFHPFQAWSCLIYRFPTSSISLVSSITAFLISLSRGHFSATSSKPLDSLVCPTLNVCSLLSGNRGMVACCIPERGRQFAWHFPASARQRPEGSPGPAETTGISGREREWPADASPRSASAACHARVVVGSADLPASSRNEGHAGACPQQSCHHRSPNLSAF